MIAPCCKHNYIGIVQDEFSSGLGIFQNWNRTRKYQPGLATERWFRHNRGYMDITIVPKPLEQVQSDALILPVFEGREELRFGAADLFQSGEIAAKPLELTLLH